MDTDPRMYVRMPGGEVRQARYYELPRGWRIVIPDKPEQDAVIVDADGLAQIKCPLAYAVCEIAPALRAFDAAAR